MGFNKLLADLHGAPLIQRTVEAVTSWPVERTIVVTGHEADKIAQELQGLKIAIVHNAEYSRGLSTSLRRGLEALGPDVDAALVCLGDMPLIEADTVRKLIAAYADHQTICVPLCKRTRGNPVLWGKAYFPAMMKLRGDRGAKELMAQFTDNMVEIEISDEGSVLDADTSEALGRIRGKYL